MHILIQSFLGIAERLNSSIHIRYSARRIQSMDNGGNGKEMKIEAHKGQTGSKSLVIIRPPYTYLEPVVRSMFDGAEDIGIIVDRRFHERRKAGLPGEPNRRRPTSERRASTPMLDIVIDVDA
jgi:hypothetical protein